MIIALSGLCYDPQGNKCSAGAGKDTVANVLLEQFSFVKIGFADPMKRFVQDVFNFSDDQVWGESQHRNSPDVRYPRPPNKRELFLEDHRATIEGMNDGAHRRVDQKPVLYLTPPLRSSDTGYGVGKSLLRECMGSVPGARSSLPARRWLSLRPEARVAVHINGVQPRGAGQHDAAEGQRGHQRPALQDRDELRAGRGRLHRQNQEASA